MSTKLGKIIADFRTSLSTTLAVGDTSATLQSATDDDGVALPSGTYFFTLDGNSSSKEHITCSLTGTAISSIKSVSRQGVQTSGVARKHRIGATVEITDFAHIKELNNLLDGTTDLNASTPLKYDGTATISNDAHLATKKYVDDTAVSGAPDASTTVKGLVEIATDAELQAGTGTGGTGAVITAAGSSFNQTAAANKVPVAKANSKLDDGWLGMSSAGQIPYSDGTDIQALSPTTARYLRMNGTTPEWGGQYLDTANTFFTTSTMSAANSNTLVGGSDASSLHYLDSYNNGLSELLANNQINIKLNGFNTQSWTTTLNGAGSVVTETLGGNLIATGGANGDDSIVYTSAGITTDGNLTFPLVYWTSKINMAFAAIVDSTTSQDLILGGCFRSPSALTECPANAVTVERHFAFLVDDGILYASVADNTTQNKTDISSGVTLTNRNVYEIVYQGGTSAVFKVNGTTKATLSTNLPSGTSDFPHPVFGATTRTADHRGMLIDNNIVFKFEP